MQLDQQPERTGELVFYVDECLKSSHVLTALGAALAPGERMTVAPKGVQDEDWLPIVGQVRWVCLSKDRKMLARPNEIQAILRFKVAMIQLVEANAREHARLLVAALPLIRKAARTLARAFVARVEPDASVRIIYEGGARLKRGRSLTP